MTLKVSGKLSVKVVNPDLFKKTHIEILEREQRKAIAEWVKAIIRKIPVYTGTAHGTFAPVGRTVRSFVPYQSNNTRKKIFRYKGKTYPLGFNEGESYQEHYLTSETLGPKIVFTFVYKNTLPYVVWNEHKPGPEWFQFKVPPPWKAVTNANDVYIQYIKNAMATNLPKTLKLVSVEVVKAF